MKFKCPFCDKEYVNSKVALYSHMEKEHAEQVKDMSPAQVYFNFKNKYPLHKGNGKCIICGGNTLFNDKTERYERLCTNPVCKERYRQMFRDRMMKKHGKETLLDEPEQQKKMLANRKISGVYTWKDGITKFNYTGSYEKNFLEFMDLVLDWNNPNDIIMPAPQIFYYKYNDKNHFYIPDVYITSLNLLIEIKSSENKHYRERDIDQEKLKDRSVLSSKEYNYIKLFDNKFNTLVNYLLEIKDK